MKSFQKSKLGSILLCEDVIAEVCTQSAKSFNVPERSTAKAWGTSFPLASDSLLRIQEGKKKGISRLNLLEWHCWQCSSHCFGEILPCVGLHNCSHCIPIVADGSRTISRTCGDMCFRNHCARETDKLPPTWANWQVNEHFYYNCVLVFYYYYYYLIKQIYVAGMHLPFSNQHLFAR